MPKLSGWKTYAAAGGLVLLSIATKLGWLDAATAEGVRTMLLGGGLAALRAGVAKVEKAEEGDA